MSSKDSRPLSELYYHAGHQVRLFTDGWHCTCYEPNCEHIKAAKVIHEKKKPINQKGDNQ